MDFSIWIKYAASFRGAYARTLLGGVLAFATGLTLVPIPLLVGYAFDEVIPSGRAGTLVWVGLAILGLQALGGLGTLLTRYVILGVTKQAVARLRGRAVTRLLEAPRSYYGRHDRGELHDMVVHETERVDVMSNALLAEVAPALVLSVGVCGVLVMLNWVLVASMLAVVPLNLLAGRRLGSLVRRQVAGFHRSFQRFSQSILFLVRAIDLTRIQTAETLEAARQTERIEELRSTSRIMGWVSISYTSPSRSSSRSPASSF